MIEIKLSEFKEKVLENTKPVLVDFSAVWCGPCGMMAPVLNELSAEFQDKAHVFKIDFDEAMSLAEEYGIMSVPTMMFFKDGKEIDRIVGVTPASVISDKLNSLI